MPKAGVKGFLRFRSCQLQAKNELRRNVIDTSRLVDQMDTDLEFRTCWGVNVRHQA